MHASLPRQSRARGLLAVAICVLGLLAAAAPGRAAGDAPPVVVELFTSQGCSSCPPADQYLSELAMRPDVLALSLHVDYWDYIGWKDPFGSPMNTERQRRYASTLGLRYVFTPQIIVDGWDSVVGSDRLGVESAITASRARDKPAHVSFRPDDGGVVHIDAGQAPDEGAAIWLAVYDKEHKTEVKRGENSGRSLHNSNVVRSFERLGTWMGKALDIPLDLSTAAARGRTGCAVIVQDGRSGRVIGAADMKLEKVSQAD